jgi:hypothetical protein
MTVLLKEFEYIIEYLKLPITFTRYYADGMCREGEACRYLHQEQAGSSLGTSLRTGPSETFCRFFQRGSCAYGSHCRFVHAFEVSTSSTNNVRQNTSLASSSTTRKNSLPHVNKKDQGTRYWYNFPVQFIIHLLYVLFECPGRFLSAVAYEYPRTRLLMHYFYFLLPLPLLSLFANGRNWNSPSILPLECVWPHVSVMWYT